MSNYQDDYPLHVPPHNTEAEQAVLGGLMLDPDRLASVALRLEPDDFYRKDHRLIYQAIRELAEAGSPFDAVTMAEWVEKNKQAEEIEPGYMIELANTTPSAANIAAYADVVAEKATLRRLIDAGTLMASEGFNPDGQTATEVYARAVARVSAIGNSLPDLASAPLDLFGVANPPECRPEWLPPQIAAYAFQAAQQMGTGADVLSLSSIVTCAAALHDAFQVQPKATEPGWRESARLWGLVVGDPSVKKTNPMRRAMATLSRMNSEMEARYAGIRASYDRDMKVHAKIEQAAIRQEAAGQGLAEKNPPPDRPVHNRIILNDPTLEAMGELLADNERGMLFYRDEMAGWFDSMGAYSKTGSSGRDRTAWIEAYGGGQYIVDRIGRGTTVIPNWSCSILGTIQPDRIRALASRMEDDGLLQRFIVAYIPTEKRRESEEAHDEATYRAYLAMVEKLYTLQPPQGTFVTMSPEADAVRRELTDSVSLLTVSEALPAMLRSHIGKWLGLFPRLCLTYHAIGCVSSGKYPTAVPITGTTARRVQQFITRWVLPQAMHFYTSILLNASPGAAAARELASAILGNGLLYVTRRDLARLSNRYRTGKEWEQDGAVRTLVDSGWLLADKATGKGFKIRADGWAVAPQVHVLFAERAAQERQRRADSHAALVELRGMGIGHEDPEQSPAVRRSA